MATQDTAYTSTDPIVQEKIKKMQQQVIDKSSLGSIINPRPIIKKDDTTVSPTIDPNAPRPDLSTTSSNPYEDAAQKFYGDSANSGTLVEPSYNDIRQQTLTRAQSLVDATEALFQQDMLRLRNEGEASSARTSSIAVGAGLAGSPFQATMEGQTQSQNEQVYAARSAERSAEIQKILADAEGQATNQYDAELLKFQNDRAYATENRDKYITFLKEKQTADKKSGTDKITALAQSGHSIDELTPEDFKKLLETSGMSEFEARLLYSKNTPQANGTITTQNGFIVNSYFDPVTQKPVVSTTALPDALKAAKELKTIETPNGVFAYDANNVTLDADGNFVMQKISGGEDKVLSVSEAESLGVPYGTTQSQATALGITPQDEDKTSGDDEMLTWSQAKEAGVDFGTTVGEVKEMGLNPKSLEEEAITTKPLTSQDVAKTDQAKKISGINELQTAIINYENLIKKFGAASGFTPGARQQLDSTKEAINLALKNAEVLGALQAPDIALVERMIPDVTREGVWGSLKGLVVPGEAKRALKTIQNVKDQYKFKAQEQLDSLVALGASPDDPFIQNLAKQQGLIIPKSPEGQSQEFDLNTDEGANDYLDSFNNDLSKSLKSSDIGSLSQKFESGGDPGAIGFDNTGGYSYGTYQLAHNNAQKFIQDSTYKDDFKGITFNSPQFKTKWKEIATKDPEGFKKAQHDFIEKTHFAPQLVKLSKAGIDVKSFSPVLQDVIWSTSVQHGANTNIVASAIKALPKNASEKDVIKEIYKRRWSGGQQFASSTPSVKNAVKNRFFGENGELETALSRLTNTA